MTVFDIAGSLSMGRGNSPPRAQYDRVVGVHERIRVRAVRERRHPSEITSLGVYRYP